MRRSGGAFGCSRRTKCCPGLAAAGSRRAWSPAAPHPRRREPTDRPRPRARRRSAPSRAELWPVAERGVSIRATRRARPRRRAGSPRRRADQTPSGVSRGVPHAAPVIGAQTGDRRGTRHHQTARGQRAGHQGRKVGQGLRPEQVFERAQELPQRIKTALAQLFQTALHDALELGETSAFCFAQRLGRAVADLVRRGTFGRARERMTARQQFIQHHPERELIALPIDVFAEHLFRAQIRRARTCPARSPRGRPALPPRARRQARSPRAC